MGRDGYSYLVTGVNEGGTISATGQPENAFTPKFFLFGWGQGLTPILRASGAHFYALIRATRALYREAHIRKRESRLREFEV